MSTTYSLTLRDSGISETTLLLGRSFPVNTTIKCQDDQLEHSNWSLECDHSYARESLEDPVIPMYLTRLPRISQTARAIDHLILPRTEDQIPAFIEKTNEGRMELSSTPRTRLKR